MNNHIEVNGKKFPLRTLVAVVGGVQQEITISVHTLESELHDDIEARLESSVNIDETIYFYVDDEDINRPAKQICEDCLDEPCEFIEEVGEFMVARLVDFSLRTRVVVNANATDDEIVVEAKPKIIDKVHNELGENLEEIHHDDEVPYGTLEGEIKI